MPDAKARPGGDKILGMPKGAAIALFAGGGLLLFLWWQSRQSSSGAGQSGAPPRNVYLTMPGHWQRAPGGRSPEPKIPPKKPKGNGGG